MPFSFYWSCFYGYYKISVSSIFKLNFHKTTGSFVPFTLKFCTMHHENYVCLQFMIIDHYHKIRIFEGEKWNFVHGKFNESNFPLNLMQIDPWSFDAIKRSTHEVLLSNLMITQLHTTIKFWWRNIKIFFLVIIIWLKINIQIYSTCNSMLDMQFTNANRSILRWSIRFVGCLSAKSTMELYRLCSSASDTIQSIWIIIVQWERERERWI